MKFDLLGRDDNTTFGLGAILVFLAIGATGILFSIALWQEGMNVVQWISFILVGGFSFIAGCYFCLVGIMILGTMIFKREKSKQISEDDIQ